MLEAYFENQYVRALVIFLVVFVVLRLLIFVVARILPRLVSKTKTQVDDVILKKTSMPFTIIALLAGIRLSIGEVNIAETWDQTVDGILMTLMIFSMENS